jgi:hypothetical protein
MGEEIVRHVLAQPAEAGRPTEHADAVIVAVSDHVSAGLDQHLHHLEVAGNYREMQRGGVVGVIADVDVGASLQQQPHAGVPVARRCPVQSRLLLVAAATRVNQVGMSVE